MGNLGIEGKISSVFIPMETHSHIKSSYCDCISPFGCAVILKLGYFIGGTGFFFYGVDIWAVIWKFFNKVRHAASPHEKLVS